MESRERALEVVRQAWRALREVDEIWRSDHLVVLTAVQQNGHNLQYATEALRGDREIVLAAVQQNGDALQYATEALRGDREVVHAAVQCRWAALQHATETLKSHRDVVLTALQRDARALQFAADDLLEDPTFATAVKRTLHLLKLTMLSGRSTVVVAGGCGTVAGVLRACRRKLGLPDDGSTLELWHGSERVPDDDTEVRDWPGIQPKGEISEYQLVVTQ
eukprot:6491033-Amphidinium_carterae.1